MLTLNHASHGRRENCSNCSCDNVKTFGELMGQLNDTANKDLSCYDDETGVNVTVFDAFGTPGMVLESTLKVRPLQKLTDNIIFNSMTVTKQLIS